MGFSKHAKLTSDGLCAQHTATIDYTELTTAAAAFVCAST